MWSIFGKKKRPEKRNRKPGLFGRCPKPISAVDGDEEFYEDWEAELAETRDFVAAMVILEEDDTVGAFLDATLDDLDNEIDSFY